MSNTKVTIQGRKFLINSEYAYSGRTWRDIEIEGLLFNTRMVQGIFDDKNPETVSKWAYQDTGRWDADRNLREFLGAMPLWKAHGVLCFTLNLQGGSPEGYSQEQPWSNSAFLADGSLDKEYLGRLERILNKADELGMIVILGYFYFGQDHRLQDEAAVVRAVMEITGWILDKAYTNVLVEINNECDILYTHPILRSERVHELIELVRSMKKNGQGLLVSASFSGGVVPSDNVIEKSDYILIHGNGIEDMNHIDEMINRIKGKNCYNGQPIMFNEDDHFEFGKDMNHMLKAIKNGASWGYFDPGSSNYSDGYQCPPINWGINTQRKKEFFGLVKMITGV
jgi:hypothetical protein